MGLFQLTMYGVGLTLGAGIYVLIGEAGIYAKIVDFKGILRISKESCCQYDR